MNASNAFVYSPEENAILFFRNVKKELGIPSSRHLIKLVTKVMAHVRRDLSISQILKLVNHLPGIFHLILMNHPHRPRTMGESTILHLDEFVDHLYQEDRNSKQPVFSTEVDALNAVVIILKRMDKYLNLFSYNILKYPMVTELTQIEIL